MWKLLYWKSWSYSQSAIKDFFISKYILDVEMNSVGLHKPVSQRQDTACYLIRQLFQEAVAHSFIIYHLQQCFFFSSSTFISCHFTSTLSHIQTYPWLEQYDLLDPSMSHSALTKGQTPYGSRTAQRLWVVLNTF